MRNPFLLLRVCLTRKECIWVIHGSYINHVTRFRNPNFHLFFFFLSEVCFSLSLSICATTAALLSLFGFHQG
ncbi:hypothetical protein Hanom_Chr09g00776321 [Helianthus anomalus]